MRKSILLLFAVSLMSMTASPGMTEVPRLMNYQGVLTDASGSPIDGYHTLTFRVHGCSGGDADALWEEVHEGVEVREGVFNVVLGGLAAIPEGLFSEGERWLSVSVDTDSELLPRTRITPVPWALRAGVADMALRVKEQSAEEDHIMRTDLSTPGMINDPHNPIDWTRLKGVPLWLAAAPDAPLLAGERGWQGKDDDKCKKYGDNHSLDALDCDPMNVVYVNEEGNVGVGTTEPVGGFHVHGDGRTGEIMISGDSDSGQTYSQLSLNGNSFDSRWAIAHKVSGSGLFENVLVVERHEGGSETTAIMVQPDATVRLGRDLVVDGGISQHWADFVIQHTPRGSGGRALVHWVDNTLCLNHAGDFTGGTEVDGSHLRVRGYLQIDGGADIAEPFEVVTSDEVRPGTVMSVDPDNSGMLKVSEEAYDRCVAGIISGAGGIRPGMIMGQDGTAADGEWPLALTGRVYCQVDASYAPIKPGDLLTTSNTPGHAMKVIDYGEAQGAILGKAMTDLASGKGLVLVLVGLQ